MTSRELVGRLEDAAEKWMSELTLEHASGLDVERAARVGMPYAEILRYASDNRIDLIVMAPAGVERFRICCWVASQSGWCGAPVLTVRQNESETFLI